MTLSREVAERFTKVNSRAGHSRRPGGPLRLGLLFRAIVAVMAVVPCLLALQAVAGQAASAATAPAVTSVTPGSGVDTGGTAVTITGSGFTGATAVMFGSTAVTFTVASDTEITATTANSGNGTVDVTVTTPDGTSPITPSDQFTFIAAPTVTGVSPNVGPVAGGTVVTITGTGFTGATAVLFGQTAATSFTVNSDTQITATAPAGSAGGAPILVFTPIGSSLNSIPVSYVYETAPVVQSVSPFTGSTAGGTRVTINGSGFLGATAVNFGSTPATSFTVLANDEIFAIPPAHSPGTVQITVTTPGGTSATSAGANYLYVTPLAVTGVSPASGPTAGGNTVTITGTDFTDVSIVNFGSVPATNFTVDSDTQITATAPAGTAGTVNVLVFNGTSTSAASAADQYTYQAATCTTTITGTSAKQLTVASGLTCLVNATQNGQVTVEPGAALSVTNSTVNGTVTANSPAAITFCGATEHGALSVTGPTQGPVILGGTLADGTACSADTIPSVVSITGATAPVTVTGLKQNGTLTLENDSDGVTLNGSQVNGLVYVENNTSPLEAGIMVSGNTVTGSLYCTGNNPAPIDYGAINTVSGTASGQCADLAER